MASVTLIKLSILSFYKRLFPTRKFGIAVYIVCAFVIMWFITFFFATLLQQVPIYGNWTIPGIQEFSGTIIDAHAMYVCAAALEILLDLVILTLPLFVIWKLQMHREQKMLVTGIFLLGALYVSTPHLRLRAYAL